MGMTAGSLSTVIVPREPVNPTRGEPAEERAVPGHGAVGGQHGGYVAICECVHETATDSATCGADAAVGAHNAVVPCVHALSSRVIPAHAEGWSGSRLSRTATEYEQDLETNLASLL